MAKVKKAKMVTPKGIAVWPSITKEATFKDAGTGKFECRLKFNKNDPAFEKFAENLTAQRDEGIQKYLDKLSQDPKATKQFNVQKKWMFHEFIKPVLDDQGEETEFVEIKFTRKIDKGVPRVVDSKGTVIKKVPNITGGSVLRIAYGVGFGYAMAASKFLGAPLYMNDVQLLELASFASGGSADDFEIEEDGYEYDENAFVADEVDSEDGDDEDEDF